MDAEQLKELSVYAYFNNDIGGFAVKIAFVSRNFMRELKCAGMAGTQKCSDLPRMGLSLLILSSIGG